MKTLDCRAILHQQRDRSWRPHGRSRVSLYESFYHVYTKRHCVVVSLSFSTLASWTSRPASLSPMHLSRFGQPTPLACMVDTLRSLVGVEAHLLALLPAPVDHSQLAAPVVQEVQVPRWRGMKLSCAVV